MALTAMDYLKRFPTPFELGADHPSAQEAVVECVIVEPRCMPELPCVLGNVSYMMPNAAVTIFHSKENADAVSAATWDTGIRAICMFDGNIDIAGYNKLLTSSEFYSTLSSPHTLIFQTDSGIFANRVLRFLEYDYVGAPWPWVAKNGSAAAVGNGGLSLRNRKLCEKICEGRSPGSPASAEDLYFAEEMRKRGANVPNVDVASSFSVEHSFHPDPMGFHQAYRFHPSLVVNKWYSSVPSQIDTRPHEYDKVLDAWFIRETGYMQNAPQDLKTWLSAGIGPQGLTIPKGTRIPGAPSGPCKLCVRMRECSKLFEFALFCNYIL